MDGPYDPMHGFSVWTSLSHVFNNHEILDPKSIKKFITSTCNFL